MTAPCVNCGSDDLVWDKDMKRYWCLPCDDFAHLLGVGMSEADFMPQRTLSSGMVKNTVTGVADHPTTTPIEDFPKDIITSNE